MPAGWDTWPQELRLQNDVALSLGYPNVSFNQSRPVGVEFEKVF